MTVAEPVGVPGLVARTRFAADDRPVLDHLGARGHAWIRDGVGFVTAGVAAVVPATDATRFLRSVRADDPVRRPGTGPIAVGALPFADPSRASLVVPARVVGIAADGTRWATEITGAATATVPAPDGPVREPAAPVPAEAFVVADRESWEAKVRVALERIRRGELSKLVLARQVVVDATRTFDAPALLAKLAATQPGCFVYAAPRFVGASPELLVARNGARVWSRPMAGTVARGVDGAADAVALTELAASAKDALEHRLVVDDVVGVLEKHCTDVTASPVPEIARLPDVAHLATTITARVGTDDHSALDLALALHPTPAVGGCPTDAALAALAELEGFDRGRYAGPVGWVDATGNGEWAVALRGAEVEGGRAIVRAGAGIVEGSDPGAEWRETEAKLATVLGVLTG
ncbi:MAG: isochorismate synthase [Acidimicrobiia bacterium]